MLRRRRKPPARARRVVWHVDTYRTPLELEQRLNLHDPPTGVVAFVQVNASAGWWEATCVWWERVDVDEGSA